MSREPVNKWVALKLSAVAVTGIAATTLTIIALVRQP
jgi:hypothetical protein